jgi:hypothetical protein
MNKRVIVIIAHTLQEAFITYAKGLGYDVVIQDKLPNTISGNRINKIIVDDFYEVLTSPIAIDTIHYGDNHAKPPKNIFSNKQANRQSFRQSMRSVNRNR